MKELIATRISTKELIFEPGKQPAEFDVTVLNNSDQFATFQVEVQAAGAENTSGRNWYRLSPEICTKKPPGDSTRFSIQLTDLPKPGFVGLMNLTVRVFSLELRDAENRQVLRLTVPGAGVAPPELKFPSNEFRGEPGDRIKIPLSVTNFNRQPANITLRLRGLESTWFPDGTDQVIHLLPTGSEDVVFWCELPAVTQALSGTYPFVIEASQPQAMPVQVQGQLTVLPQGRIVFRCHPPVLRIPASLRKWQGFLEKTGEYTLSVDNCSNLRSVLRATVTEQTSGISVSPVVKWIRSAFSRFGRSQFRSAKLEVTPDETLVEVGSTETMLLTVQHRRPWFGGIRHRRFQAVLESDADIDIQNETQTLELHVLPLLPIWLQITGGLALLFITGWNVSHLFQTSHSAPVNSVRLNGLATQIVSVSSDRTIQRWQIRPHSLQSQGILGTSDKAIRVVRYRPVNNDQIAVGYENGEMQIWNLLSGKESPAFESRKDDRVFDLLYSQDARSLFTGHASGSVFQWMLEPKGSVDSNIRPRMKQVGFSVNALALVGTNQSHIAIAGRFNQLTLWNLTTDQLTPIPYGGGSERNYILSIASPTQKPFLLATADNQGTIRLWNLRPCLTGTKACELKDEWTADSGAVRAISLSENGCYLASAGDNGQAKLWTLTSMGDRRRQDAAGRLISQSSESLNAIDLLQVQDEVTVTSGGDDNQVRLSRIKQSNPECQ